VPRGTVKEGTAPLPPLPVIVTLCSIVMTRWNKFSFEKTTASVKRGQIHCIRIERIRCSTDAIRPHRQGGSLAYGTPRCGA
jgi:hypothetical protein